MLFFFVFQFRIEYVELDIFGGSQDEKLQSEPEFEFSLSQLSDRPFLLLGLALSNECPQEKVGPSRSPKQPRIEQ